MIKSWSRQQWEAEQKKNPRRLRNKTQGEFTGIPLGSEDEMQAYVFKWVNLHMTRFPLPKLVFAVPNGTHTTRTGRGILKVTGRRSGVPDICLPVSMGQYFGLWIELKVPGNYPSPEQREWHERLREQGHRVEVLKSWHDAVNTIIEYLGLPIEKV